MSTAKSLNLRGMRYFPGFLDRSRQERIVADLRHVAAVAPLFSPTTRFGKKMSVQLTSAGAYGWYSDASGYRYETKHPDGQPWPEIPQSIREVWAGLFPKARAPECCLVNYYDAQAKMGMHQDRDEQDFSQPVLSISLGDDALFRLGNETRGGKTESLWLSSGDVIVLEGRSRLLFHGIDRIKPNTSDLLSQGGRLNLTLRVVS